MPPIYEYMCLSCNKVNTVMQKANDPAPEQCEFCSSGPLNKMLSKTSFVLKGGGWYKDNYNGNAPTNNSHTHSSPSCCSGCPHSSNDGKTCEKSSNDTTKA